MCVCVNCGVGVFGVCVCEVITVCCPNVHAQQLRSLGMLQSHLCLSMWMMHANGLTKKHAIALKRALMLPLLCWSTNWGHQQEQSGKHSAAADADF